jgi:hypothetical protein
MYYFHQEVFAYAVLSSQETMLKSARDRVKSWVMTSPTEEGFVRLPNEKTLYASPPRTSLSISSLNSFPGTEPFSAKSDGGVVYITNQRVRFSLHITQHLQMLKASDIVGL